MHGENLTVIQDRIRASLSLLVAVTVCFSLCDADQISAPRALVASALDYLASLQKELPEQKAPRDLTFWRMTEDSGMSRSLASSSSRVVDDELGFRFALSAAKPWIRLFGWHLNAFESPRAPPREGPTHLC